MALTVASKEDENTYTIRISGRFDFSIHREFRDAYRYNEPDAKYIIDLSDAEYMDSAALGMLLLLRKQLNGQVGKIRVINCNPTIKKVFSVSKIDKMIDVS